MENTFYELAIGESRIQKLENSIYMFSFFLVVGIPVGLAGLLDLFDILHKPVAIVVVVEAVVLSFAGCFLNKVRLVKKRLKRIKEFQALFGNEATRELMNTVWRIQGRACRVEDDESITT